MDFFASQDLARRKTKWLVFYYVLAIVFMVLGIYAAVILVANYDRRGEPMQLFNPMLLAVVTIGNLAVVGLGSAYKIVEMRGGGDHVAAMLGGTKVPPNTRDRDQRMLVNVVEEMALAAGIPVPAVYVLEDEPGINAFAAGYTPAEAVIGVNRGTLETLSREELQGVIAHEFSHIMNGDMRLNIRLIGVLFGIQLIAMIGYFILRFGSGGGHSRRQEGKGSGGGAIVLVAFALLVFGSVGRFFARLIKASISRQREFLADASAVQFTRNPQGIAGALKMIGAHQGHALLKSPEAEEASHMFFGSAVKAMVSAFATHPPLLDRIHRVDPDFQGDFRAYAGSRARTTTPIAAEKGTAQGGADREKSSRGAGTRFTPGMDKLLGRFAVDPAQLLAGIGTISAQNVSYAHQLLGVVPGPLRNAAHEPFSARCVVLAFLLDASESVRQTQLQMIAEREGDPSAGETISLWRFASKLDIVYRLPLLEIVQGTLSGLSIDQYQSFRTTCIHLIKADGRLDIFEFYLRHHILMHLDRRFQLRARPKIDIEEIAAVQNELQLLLSAFVQIGHEKPDAALAALVAGLEQAGLPTKSAALQPWKYRDLETCLEQLSRCAPGVKKLVLQAVVTAMTHDQQITVKEAETFRAFAESIDCPVPPMVPSPS